MKDPIEESQAFKAIRVTMGLSIEDTKVFLRAQQVSQWIALGFLLAAIATLIALAVFATKFLVGLLALSAFGCAGQAMSSWREWPLSNILAVVAWLAFGIGGVLWLVL